MHISGVLQVGNIHDFNFAPAANKRHPPVRLHLSYSSSSFLSLAVQPFLHRIFWQSNTTVIFLFLAMLVALHFTPVSDSVSGLQFRTSLAMRLASLFILLPDKDGLRLPEQKGG